MKRGYAKPKIESIGTLNELGKEIKASSISYRVCIYQMVRDQCPYEYV